MFSFFKKKITIKKLSKVDLLVFRDRFKELNFSGIKSAVYPDNEINLWYLLKSLFFGICKNKNFRSLYFFYIIKDFSPKLAIGSDMDLKIFKIIKIFPNIKSICYEGSYTFDRDKVLKQTITTGNSYNDSIEYIQNKKKIINKYSPNYYFVYDQRSKKILKEVHNSNFFVHGSVRNNEIKQQKKNIKFDIMLISNYRPLNTKASAVDYKMQKKFNSFLLKIAKIINSYCLLKNKKLAIALTSTRKDKEIHRSFLDQELNFFKDIKFSHFPAMSSYNLSDICDISVSTSSELGYHLLAKKQKVLFINNNKKFIWHFFKKKEDAFFYQGEEKKMIKKKIDKILAIDERNYCKMLDAYDIVEFDSNNAKLKKFIKKKLS